MPTALKSWSERAFGSERGYGRDAYLGMWLGLINDQIECGSALRMAGVEPSDDEDYRQRAQFIDTLAALSPFK